MRLHALTWLPAAVTLFAVTAFADKAAAQCGPVCPPPPPPCCEPPPPPPPPPPGPCCEQPPAPPCCGGGNVNVNVNVNAGASARAGAAATVIVAGGGGAYVNVEQPYPTTIQGLHVGGGMMREVIKVPFESRRRVERRVVIRAVCMDDRGRPHPAAQVRPDRDVWGDYDGELYRCLAGTWMQVTIADWQGSERFEHGETTTCRKGDSLWHAPGGTVECKPQRPERDCNERSLLRRYGVGVKVLTMWYEETYTEYREEVVVREGWAVQGGAITLDGGVGGRVF